MHHDKENALASRPIYMKDLKHNAALGPGSFKSQKEQALG
jgi:hypothetical protein